MTWASVLITLFIYFPLFLIALRQPYQLILDPLSTPYNFFCPFFPCPQYSSNIPLISYLPLTPHH